MHPLRHGYTNDTRGDGAVVLKRYQGPDAAGRRDTERAVLTRLAGGLPTPAVVSVRDDAVLMEHLPGVHGQDLIAAGHAGAVLHSCGTMLRRLQQADVTAVFPAAQAGAVLVHGDYGPNNMLFDPQTYAVTAVLDWEWAHPGDPVDDLAWCEWIVRRHHPGEVGALGQLFAGYGERPPWPQRQAAALAKCQALRDMVRTWPGAEAGVHRWQENIDLTRSWTEQN